MPQTTGAVSDPSARSGWKTSPSMHTQKKAARFLASAPLSSTKKRQPRHDDLFESIRQTRRSPHCR